VPSVIQSIEPYVSSEDIDKGARWSTDIAKELEQASFGLLCVTRSNVSSAWLSFEAGALGKSVDKSRVCPFLFRVKRSEVTGPLLQFQSTIYEEDDILKLLKSINAACDTSGIEESRLEKAFQVWWPTLQKVLNEIPEEGEGEIDGLPKAKPQQRGGPYLEKMLEEILELTRVNQKLLRSPEEILPRGYMHDIMVGSVSQDARAGFGHPVFEDLFKRFLELLRGFKNTMEACPQSDGCREAFREATAIMMSPLEYIADRSGRAIMRGLYREIMGEF